MAKETQDTQENKNAFDDMASQDAPVFEVEVNPPAFDVDIDNIASFDEEDEDQPEVIDNKDEDQENKREPDTPNAESEINEEEQGESEEDQEPEKPTSKKPTEDKDEESDVDEKYSNYSESALIALSEIKEGNFPLNEDDIPEDLDALTLRNLYRKHAETQVESIKSELYQQAGEVSEFMKFLMEGGDPRAVQNAMSNQSLVDMDLGEEANQKKILTELYKDKGLPQEDVEEIVESIFDKGKNLERAQQAQNEFKQKQKQILENAKKQREAEMQAEQERQKEYVEKIDSIINSGEIAGYKLSANDKKELREAMSKPTEIVEVVNPQTGQPEKRRATKTQALQLKMQNDPEMRLAYNLWLLKGANFDFAKQQAYQESDDDMRSLLERRKKSTKKSKKLKTSGNAWQDLYS